MVSRKQRACIIKDDAHRVGEKWFVRIRLLEVQPTKEYPDEIKYTLALINLRTGKRVLGLDNYGGHGHHMHIDNEVRPYVFKDKRQLLRDFWASVEEYKREQP